MIIYSITNKINNKQYLGQTTESLNQRWIRHKSNARLGKDYPLYRAIRKYGIDNFEIEEISKADTIDELNSLEIEAIKIFITLVPNGYNLDSGGNNNKTLHPTTRIKLKLAALGNKNAKNHHTEESRRKMSISQTGRTHSEKTKLKMRQSKIDLKASEETRKRMSISAKNRWINEKEN